MTVEDLPLNHWLMTRALSHNMVMVYQIVAGGLRLYFGKILLKNQCQNSIFFFIDTEARPLMIHESHIAGNHCQSP